MKFTISYKFKLKMAQNLSGRSGPVKCRSGPVRAGQDRSDDGQGRSVPVVLVRCRSGLVGAGAGAASASSAGAGAADRPQETLYVQE